MKKIKNKKILGIALSVIFVLFFVGVWNIVEGNYDKQNKVILSLKKFIPTKISRKIRVFSTLHLSELLYFFD